MARMRSYFAILVIVIFAVSLFGCSSKDTIDVNEYAVTENNELGCVELNIDGVTFRPYGVIPDSSLRGNQIGVRDDEPNSKIFEVNGYSSAEWIIDFLDVPMGGGDMLFKAVGVTDIPEDLEQYNEYDY